MAVFPFRTMVSTVSFNKPEGQHRQQTPIQRPDTVSHTSSRRSGVPTRKGKRLAVLALTGGLTVQPSLAAADALENLTSGWFTVEAIVFQRTTATGTGSPEQLIRTEERRIPANIQTLDYGTPLRASNIDPPTRSTLEFPVLTLHCGEVNTGGADRPATHPAWYQPPFPNIADELLNPAAIDTPSAGFDTFGTPPPPDPFAMHPCAPPHSATPENDPAAAIAENECPPLALDLPLRPSTATPVCTRAAGRPAPAITPKLQSHPLLDWLLAVRRFEIQLREGSYRTGLADAGLSREANRIRNSEGLELLWHGRWTQPVPGRNAPRPVLVQAGPQFGNQHELEGFFAMTRSGLLHLQAQLWLSQTDRQLPDATPAGAPGQARAREQPSQEDTLDPSFRHMVLDEHRVMRKGKLHYLDHPKLGILVRADPIQAPDWLADALAAFVGD